MGSGRLTGRDSEPASSSTAGKDSRGERREPLRSTNQRERTFDRDQQRNFPSRSDVRDKALDKDRRTYDRPSTYDREYSRGNRYQVGSGTNCSHLRAFIMKLIVVLSSSLKKKSFIPCY